MPAPLFNSAPEFPMDIVNDNARQPTEELLEKTCSYRRKRVSIGAIPKPAPVSPPKPSRWDAIPVSKNLPSSSMKMQSMSLNDCARMSLRRPERRGDEKSPIERLSQPLKPPTRSSGYADAASILELALAEVDFTDDLSDDFSDLQIAATL